MNAKYVRSPRTIPFALLISIIMMMSVPGNVITAAAREASLALPGFVKVSPADGISSEPVSLTLKWNAAPSNPYGFNRYYKYCYYASGGTCSFNGVLTTTQVNIAGLAKGTTYYWQIQVVYCKDSRCLQKEKHEADDGKVWSFKTIADPPADFSKLSPGNNATNITGRTLSWVASVRATSYQFCFSPNNNDINCNHLNGWIDVGNVNAYTIPIGPKFIWGNRYYWQIRASNGGGTTLANGGVWWNFTTTDLVGRATLVSPTGVITQSTPTYRWNHVSGVTWYYLWVNGPSGNVFKQWYEATAVCSGGTCSITPAITLGAGNFTWWIQTYNSTGFGPWSNGLSFNTPVPTPPGAAVLVSPNGNLGANYSPTYTWNEASGATWYYLWINNASGNVFKQWYQATSICSGATCSVTPAITLGGGAHTWWVQTRNSVGDGPWSAGMTFNTQPAPGIATLISPNGVTSNPPNFSWNREANATWYYLWVNNSSGNIFKQWYQASAICNTTTCTVNAPISPGSGSYKWWVQTWNRAGYGPWSSGMDFSIP